MTAPSEVTGTTPRPESQPEPPTADSGPEATGTADAQLDDLDGLDDLDDLDFDLEEVENKIAPLALA